MIIKGIIKNIKGYINHNNIVIYKLYLGNYIYDINNMIGYNIKIIFENKKYCLYCGNLTKYIYNGYCFFITKTLPQCDICMIKPNLCHFTKGSCRNPIWGMNNCYIPHIIYLSNTSNIKIGITKITNIPSRWIDQGAIQALPICITNSRIKSGIIEKKLSLLLNDKTNWRKMLYNIKYINLYQYIDTQLLTMLYKYTNIFNIQILKNQKVLKILYPILKYQYKIKSHNLDKHNIINDKLIGIKGKYFIFNNCVLNIKKYIGYSIILESNSNIIFKKNIHTCYKVCKYKTNI